MRQILFSLWALLVLCHYAIEVRFENVDKQSGTLSWVSGDGKRHFRGVVEPGGTASQSTHVGHIFELKVGDLPGKQVRVSSDGTVTFAALNGQVHVSGEAVQEGRTLGHTLYNGTKWEAILQDVRTKCREVFAKYPEDQAHFCSRKHDRRIFTQAKFDYSDEEFAQVMVSKHKERIQLNAQQPVELHNFTDVGWKIEWLPKDIHDEMLAFHKKTRTTSSHPENQPATDACLSGRESDTWVSQVPQRLGRKIFAHVRQRIHEWTGVPEDDLIETALYGIRMYHHGSVLYSHVDRVKTHVLSAILVVTRRDPEDAIPWPLTIMDHYGKVHEIADEPGQLILYESATCAHGRNTPFLGREIANVFVHFKPKGWPEEYTVKAEL